MNKRVIWRCYFSSGLRSRERSFFSLIIPCLRLIIGFQKAHAHAGFSVTFIMRALVQVAITSRTFRSRLCPEFAWKIAHNRFRLEQFRMTKKVACWQRWGSESSQQKQRRACGTAEDDAYRFGGVLEGNVWRVADWRRRWWLATSTSAGVSSPGRRRRGVVAPTRRRRQHVTVPLGHGGVYDRRRTDWAVAGGFVGYY